MTVIESHAKERKDVTYTLHDDWNNIREQRYLVNKFDIFQHITVVFGSQHQERK